jgi:hypothetical protein
MKITNTSTIRSDGSKIEWLRAAAKEGFEDIERGQYTTLYSAEDIDRFVDEVYREVSARVRR